MRGPNGRVKFLGVAVAACHLATLSPCHLVTSARAQDLARKVEEVTGRPEYQHARWGILVVDAASGTTVYERNADQFFLPASTTKLFSCAAAMLALGSEYRFETPVYRRGTLVKGRLLGDLILVASGDLTLGGRTGPDGKALFENTDHTYANSPTGQAALTPSDPLAGLKELARQVKAAGVHHVTGEVLVDDRLFARGLGTGSGPGLLTPVLVNDNVVDALVTPAAEAGKPAAVTMRPETGYVQMDAQVATVAEDKPTLLTITTTSPRSFTLRGQVPVKKKPWVRVFPVDDPAAFARALFVEVLRREGVQVDASPLAAPPAAALPARGDYDKLERVARLSSPPLGEALKVTLKVSHNLYASTLPLLLAAQRGKRTLAEGLQEQRRVLGGLGLDTASVSFGGGAGGAPADAVTPRAAVQLLQLLAQRPEWRRYRDWLPVLGVDGTLAEAVGPESPARGKVWAKTGTIFWPDTFNGRNLLGSKALAGTMTTAGGRTLFLALYVNHVPLPRGVQPSREGKALGRICEVLYENVR
jgi:D-alanyl-D-alanine carboxypeptidase/D-alanyl-D-alanine-endopeptidase (penicillin-binding protein 4)